MGYGAGLENGCNIGAYFSAIAVGNASGWAWALLALAGSWIGIKLRPLFALDAPALACAPTDRREAVPPTTLAADCPTC